MYKFKNAHTGSTMSRGQGVHFIEPNNRWGRGGGSGQHTNMAGGSESSGGVH